MNAFLRSFIAIMGVVAIVLSVWAMQAPLITNDPIRNVTFDIQMGIMALMGLAVTIYAIFHPEPT